jgi:hypothetical protein
LIIQPFSTSVTVSPPRPCKLRDASAEGAQLAVAELNSLPDEFILARDDG